MRAFAAGMTIIDSLRHVLFAEELEVPGLAEDPFVGGKVKDLRILAQGRFTTLYCFRLRGRRYALKTVSGVHHRDTLPSLAEKREVLEQLGFPHIRSINEEYGYYIMDFVDGRPVFDALIRHRHQRPRRHLQHRATRVLLHTATELHRRGWLLNDLSWRNFMIADGSVRPVDPDRVRSILEEADYIARLDGRDTYTTPLFLSVAQCLNRLPSPKDEIQGIALMIDCIYNRDYLIGEYLENRNLNFSRRNHALMLMSGYYPTGRKAKLPASLREPISRILSQHDTSISAADLLRLVPSEN
jgi:hypothetical protein